jgi:3D (Asp-Asp-Asp) domain-containing protein
MNSIFAELKSKSIITSDAVSRIKSHIASKNPGISDSRRAVILADALNRVLDQNLTHFGEEHIRRIKRLIFEHAIKKQSFEIFCSDAFQAAVELKESGEVFFDSLESWLCANLPGQFARDTLVSVVLESHRLMELSPSIDAAQIIASSEANIVAEANTQVYVAKSGYREQRNNRIRLPAAAAVVMLMAGFIFGIGRSSIDFTNTPKQIAVDGQTASVGQTEYTYEYTTLLEEDIAASQNISIEKNALKMKATAYDLSVESCGKKPGDPGYGITSSGSRATVGRTVAVDPEVIPLGSKLMIHFPDEYSHLNGIYVAEDTGRLIKGTSIDVFFGEDSQDSTDVYNAAMAFGVRYVDVWVLDDDL